MVNAPTLRALILTAAAIFPSGLAAAPAISTPTPPREFAQRTTIETILSGISPAPTRLRWLGRDRLAVELQDDEGADITQSIDVMTGTRAKIGRGAWSPSPNGALLAQHKDGILIVRRLDGAELLRAETAPDMPSGARLLTRPPVWSADSSKVAVGAIVWPNDKATLAAPEIVNGVRIVDVGASVDSRPRMTSALFVVDLGAAKDAPVSSTVDGVVRHYAFDGRNRLFYVRARYWDYPEGARRTPVLRWDIGERAPEEIYAAPGVMQSMYPSLSPDGRYLAVARDADMEIWEDFVTLTLVDLKSGETRRLAPDQRVSNLSGDKPAVWSLTGDRLFMLVRRGAFDDLYAVTMDGRARPLVQDDARRYDLQLSPDGSALSYLTEDAYGRRQARVFDLRAGGERIVAQFDDPTTRFALGRAEQIEWPNGEGQRLFGLVFYPPDFVQGRRYPLFVDIHGGGPGSRLDLTAPLTRSIAPGPLEWHAWAALGYVIFVPDYRSTGSYGADAVRSRYQGRDFAGIRGDARDIETGVRAVAAKQQIDKSRIVIRGHSAGAARVNFLLTKTDVFAAAVLNEMIDGGALSTLISFATGENTGRKFEDAYFRQMLGARLADAPADYLSDYLFDGYKIDTPTLIVTGGNRARRAASPLASEALFTVLRQYAIPARMLRFIDQGHTFTEPDAAILAFEATQQWLQVYAPETESRR